MICPMNISIIFGLSACHIFCLKMLVLLCAVDAGSGVVGSQCKSSEDKEVSVQLQKVFMIPEIQISALEMNADI